MISTVFVSSCMESENLSSPICAGDFGQGRDKWGIQVAVKVDRLSWNAMRTSRPESETVGFRNKV